MWNHAATKRTAVAVSKDGGQSWGEVSFDSELIDPICQATVILYPDLGDGIERLIWANPADFHIYFIKLGIDWIKGM
ncbi:sialidase family protein [Paenibacillus dokdonensis]|uniref:Sialidase family protein n=2 Tax=Paenibacillus dokdonensis TaxID=2567944 RepID=A0ABU6GH07_9BACL|nr:sialidase family protein [Paenibacillus dokdonensis]MEC0239041.1 sialidase family protein [Paenibacillus dokdonensis]